MKHIAITTLVVCGVLSSLPAAAAENDLQALREEIAQIKLSYEQRIMALEQRLAEMGAERACSFVDGTLDVEVLVYDIKGKLLGECRMEKHL